MRYVYILQSRDFSERYYVGVTENLRARLLKHNAGDVSHTSKYKPWRVKTYVAFSDEKQALAFERYLKTASGRAFAKNGYSRQIRLGRPGAKRSGHPPPIPASFFVKILCRRCD